MTRICSKWPYVRLRKAVFTGLGVDPDDAVPLYEDLGNCNHEFAHATDGEIITAAVTTSAPAALARHLGLQPGKRRSGRPGRSGPTRKMARLMTTMANQMTRIGQAPSS